MALRLTIVSEQSSALGRDASIVVGVGGGSIGRAHDNDWVLPDPQCYVSAHHARVQYRHGTYYLLDTSTNGVYVNGGAVRISPRNIYPLRDGDILRFGQYEVAVSIDSDGSEAEASAIFSVTATPGSTPGGQADIGVALDVQELLQAGAAANASSSRIRPVDAFGQAVSIEDTGVQPLARPVRPLALVPPVSKAKRSSRTTESGRHEAAAAAAPAEQMALEAFCRGAGLELRRLPPETQSRQLQLAGLLLREALMGLKGLALAQRELRDQAGLPAGRDEPQHIGLTGLPVEELLLRLLLGHERHELDAVQWLRDTATTSRSFDVALLRALPSALAEFTARLDPRALAHNAVDSDESVAEVGSTGVTARYRSITETPSGGLPHLFVEAFGRAFAAEFSRSAHDHSKS